MFRKDVISITEEAISSRLVELKESCPTAEREDAIKDIVKNILKYAVLSHRWLDRGEPTFYDILKSFRPYGYDKLVKFCEKASEYGCRLAWSDTCCINKDSSTELEEAIRTMFKWYRDAHICIAFLADTTSVDDLHEDVWFTRGWTLQELLAPQRMKFYGRDWKPLTSDVNDKENMELMPALSRATRIPLDDLRHFQPGTTNVHQKMMWASTRTTTRIEDVAYSLIGIFDVTMMIAYGEGKRAFYRLMEAIVHKCDEWQIFAWAGPSSSDSAAFPDSPRGYLPLDPVASNDARLPSTVIPLDDLHHFQPVTANVHQKMMWASTRTTTRIEDVAYSLIVTMMIAYGEGKRAFHRLMEAIVQKCDEWQIFAWAGPSSFDSAAFPDSPRGYLPLDPVASNDARLPSTVWRGDQNIVMTKRGLQMQVLLVDLSLQEATVYEKIGAVDVRTDAYASYTAGVVDYWCYDASGDGVLQPAQEHLCVLLRPDPRNPYAGWRKVTTANLVTIRTEGKLRRNLTTVWL